MGSSALAASLCLAGASAIFAAQAVEAPATGAKVWIGRYDEVATYLKSAPIDHEEAIPIGVTHPERIFFAKGGLVGSAAVKHLPSGIRGGFWESYKSEIAAYELDRLLGLDMVPVTVERRVGPDLASVQMWVEGCKPLTAVDQKSCPKPQHWAKQVCRQRVFDDLIANIDRNAGNLLIDDQWNLILIDHSRAFAANKMPFERQMNRIDREMFARVKALDFETLKAHLRPWVLNDGNLRGILKRRDKIVADFEAEASAKGEQAVFPW